MNHLIASLLLISSFILFSCTKKNGDTVTSSSETQLTPVVKPPQNINPKANEESLPTRGISKLVRKVAHEVIPKSTNITGKVVLNLCINTKGDVTYAKLNKKKSTLTDKSIIADALSAMNKTTFQPSSSAYSKECGQWAFIYDGQEKVRSVYL